MLCRSTIIISTPDNTRIGLVPPLNLDDKLFGTTPVLKGNDASPDKMIVGSDFTPSPTSSILSFSPSTYVLNKAINSSLSK